MGAHKRPGDFVDLRAEGRPPARAVEPARIRLDPARPARAVPVTLVRQSRAPPAAADDPCRTTLAGNCPALFSSRIGLYA